MCGVLLFCISDLAKAFTRDVLDVGVKEGGVGVFFLVESSAGPPNGERFRRGLKENEIFETDFIGATLQDCQRWQFERQSHDGSFDHDIIAIVDARSVEDGTVLIQKYYSLPEDCEPLEFGKYGVLPPEQNVWYDYRVDYRQAGDVISALVYTSPDAVYPVYYGNKEKFTDEHGVFDVREAERFCLGVDPDVKESDILKW